LPIFIEMNSPIRQALGVILTPSSLQSSFKQHFRLPHHTSSSKKRISSHKASQGKR
jgi:hypothetical protein